MFKFSTRQSRLLSTAAAALMAAASLPAFAQTQTFQFNIEPQPLDGALRAYARATRQQVLFDGTLVRGKNSPALTGSHSAEEGLAVLLASSGLEATRGSRGAYVIAAASTSAPTGETNAGSAAAVYESADIVVTARKTGERIQDVPISITAFGRDELERRGAVDLKDVLLSIPGLSFSGYERGQSNYTVRGIANSAVSATTGIYLDDIALTTISNNGSTGAFDPVFFDMERLEVLKGPQGTLYGGSAMGGAIKYVSARPDTSRASASVAAGVAMTAHGDPGYNAEVILNVPLIEDKLAVRGGFYYSHDGGYIDNVPNGQNINIFSSTSNFPTYTPSSRSTLSTLQKSDINSANTYVGRLSFLWEPDSSWSIRPALFYQNYESKGPPAYFPASGRLESSYRIRQPIKDQDIVYSLDIVKRFDAVEFTSLTAYFDRKTRFTRDASFFIGGFSAAAYPFTYVQHYNPDPTTFSQEFRISSPQNSSSPLRWLVGLYYNNQVDKFHAYFDALDPTAVFTPIVFDAHVNVQNKQYAAFGEASYRIVEGLELTAGARFYKIKQSSSQITNGALAGGLTVVPTRRSKEDGINPKYGIQYKIDRNHMIYASATKGFRSGRTIATNYPANCAQDLRDLGLDPANPPTGYKSDSLWSYEGGSKNQFSGGRITLNAAAYWLEWKRIQQNLGLPQCRFVVTANVGSARVKGLEAEARVNLIEGFDVGGNFNYNDAKIIEPSNSTTAQKGDQILGIPRWTASFYGSYSAEVNANWRMMLRADYQYQGRKPNSFDETMNVAFADGTHAISNFTQFKESYQLVNASASLLNDSMSLRLYVNNLLDKRLIGDGLSFGAETLRPRVIGIEVRRKF